MTAVDVDVDVLIVGAGLSGIGTATHLRRELPDTSYAILEARESLGGTWDLFRYPGVRSDSDMFTLGYRFKPWTDRKAIADGADILRYVEQTAREAGVDRHIRFGHKVVAASWSSEQGRWTVQAQRVDTGEVVRLRCRFILGCSGYYDYDEGYTPEFEGMDQFAGQVVHPQHWPADLDYAGRRVVVIGSGATAVTLVPELAKDAAHVTMLQRSPTYVISLPGKDPIADGLRRVLPGKAAYSLTRAKNVALQTSFYQFCRWRPELAKTLIRKGVQRQLPQGYDVDTHFSPSYAPWDQRLCVVPNGDLFRAIRNGWADVVTGRIETFTEKGVRLESGEELEADLVVTATGLNMVAFGGVALTVDGRPVDISKTMTYKAMMLSGVPNFAYVMGYTNASWTLKADLVSAYVCRLLGHMQRHSYDVCVAERDESVAEEPLMALSSGYVMRSIDQFPKQGSRAPWRLRMNYVYDLLMLRHGSVGDAMTFRRIAA